MRLQSNEATCGHNTAANGLKALGYGPVVRAGSKAEAWVVKRAGRRSETAGTDENTFARILRAVGAWHSDFTLASEDAAWGLLRSHLFEGRPVGLAVDNDTHWVVAIGLLGLRVDVADSADPEAVVSYSREELMKRWYTPGEPRIHYGVAMQMPRRKR